MDAVQSNQQFITLDVKEKYFGQYRWKLGIGTNPCLRTRINNRCKFCGFLDLKSPVQANKVHRVFQEALINNSATDIKRLELYVSGSFFDSGEVMSESRRAIVSAFSNSNIEELVVESRPEFINKRNVLDLSRLIEPRRMTIAIGIETMDENRRNLMSKGTTNYDIINSLSLIAKAGMNFQAYLLLKLPSLMNENEAVIDFIKSVNELVKLARDKNCSLIIAVQPLFIAQNTDIVRLYEKQLIRPPWLYTIAFAMSLVEKSMNNYNFKVILGNANDNINSIAIPSNYTQNGDVCHCTKKYSNLLKQINQSNENTKSVVSKVLSSSCNCKNLWVKEMAGLKTHQFQKNREYS